MKSILIKDTTREEREEIIRNSLDCGGGCENCSSCWHGGGKNDNLVDLDIYSVAKCDSNDDVLFLVGELWRIYHLTYSANNMPGYPKYEEFSSRREATEYIRALYVNDYL